MSSLVGLRLPWLPTQKYLLGEKGVTRAAPGDEEALMGLRRLWLPTQTSRDECLPLSPLRALMELRLLWLPTLSPHSWDRSIRNRAA